MAGRVISAAVGSLLVLVALLTAVHKCTYSGQCMPVIQLLQNQQVFVVVIVVAINGRRPKKYMYWFMYYMAILNL